MTELLTEERRAAAHKPGPASNCYFPNLDALRFLAFMAVFVHHAYEPTGVLPGPLDRLLFHSGGMAVSFFFVLSGFLITYLILREIERTGRLDVPAFYMRRCLRIWPLYYALVFFGLVVYPQARGVIGYPPRVGGVGNSWLYPLFLSNFDVMTWGKEGGAPLSTNITWSIAIEEQFYLAWPLLLGLTGRFRRFVFPVIIGLSAAFRMLHCDDPLVLYFHTFSVISDMAVGGAAAWLVSRSPGFVMTVERLPQWLIGTLYVAGVSLVAWHEAIGRLMPPPVAAVLIRIALSSFFAFVVLEQNYARRSLFKAGRLRLATALGLYTYGLYLLHPLAIQAARVLVRPPGDPALSTALGLNLARGTIALPIALAMGIASYHLFERPFLDLKRRFSRTA
jgi:peptidoglycan/LPS O-acetylase OafA/YrhL